jgi:hypothetical protein
MSYESNWLVAASKKRRAERHRLTDFDVREVSLVDQAANRKRLLVVKRESEMGKTGTSTLPDAGAPGAGRITVDSEEEIHFGQDPPEAAGLEKSQTIAAPVKAAAVAVATEAVERVLRLAKAIRSATIKSDAGERPLPKAIGAELRSVTALLKTLTTQYPTAPRDDASQGDVAKQQCPPGMVWDPKAGKCISEDKAKRKKREKALTAAQKSSLDAQLADVIAKATALKETVGKATTTDDESIALLDDNFGADVAGLATRMGLIAAMAPTATVKGFALVPVDGDPSAVEKAAATLALTDSQRETLTDEVEKSLDVLTETLRGVDTMREAEVDTGPLPDFVASAFAQASTSLLKVDSDYTEKDTADGGGEGDGGEGTADGDSSASEGGAEGGAADAGTDGGAAAASDAGDAGAATDAGAGDAGAGDAGAGAASADGDAVAKAIEAGITKAVEAISAKNDERFQSIEKSIEGIGTTVSEIASKPGQPNGAQPGSEPVEKSKKDEDLFDEPHDGQFDKTQIEKMKKDDEWF